MVSSKVVRRSANGGDKFEQICVFMRNLDERINTNSDIRAYDNSIHMVGIKMSTCGEVQKKIIVECLQTWEEKND